MKFRPVGASFLCVCCTDSRLDVPAEVTRGFADLIRSLWAQEPSARPPPASVIETLDALQHTVGSQANLFAPAGERRGREERREAMRKASGKGERMGMRVFRLFILVGCGVAVAAGGQVQSGGMAGAPVMPVLGHVP